MTLSNGDSMIIDTSPALGFLGLTSSVPFTSFTLVIHQRLLNIDNFTLAAAGAAPSAVPEPASLLLVAGPLALGLRRVVRKRKS